MLGGADVRLAASVKAIDADLERLLPAPPYSPEMAAIVASTREAYRRRMLAGQPLRPSPSAQLSTQG